MVALTADFELPGSASHVVRTVEGYIVVGAPIARSTNGGQNFTVVRDDGGGKPIYRVPEGPHAGLLLAGVTADTIGAAYSTDAGATWTDVFIDPGTTSFGQALAFLSVPDGPHAGRVVAACMNGLAYSDDGGVSWQLSDTWEPFVYRAVSLARLPLDAERHPGRLFAGSYDATAAGALYASDDDGATWQRVFNLGTTGGGALVRWAGGQRLFAVLNGSPGAVWRSEDAGDTWEALTPLRDAIGAEGLISVSDVEVGPDGRLWAAVKTPGPSMAYKGVYRTTQPVAVSAEAAGPSPQPFALDAAYPNPARGRITVPVVLPEASRLRVTLHDVLGREVAVLADGMHAAGRHALRLDAALPAGLYLVRAAAEGATATQKLVLMR